MSDTNTSAPRTIWKYELKETDVQRVGMPAGAELLHVASQRVEKHGPDQYGSWDALCMWALLDPDAPTVERLVAIVGTGNPAPALNDDAKYVGSAQCGPFVWHVFDGGEHWPAEARRHA